MVDGYITRYWSPTDRTFPVDRLGFLINDDSLTGKSQRQGLRKITEIQEQLSVLLGGSGDGKSTDFDWLEKQVNGTYAHRIDLLRYTKEAIDNGNLKSSVEASDRYAQAREQHQPVILLIDSFDECAFMERKLVYSVVSQLKSMLEPTDSVRVASRPDDLTHVLVESLEETFGSGAVSVYKIAPLSRNDVINFAVRNDLDSNAFMQYIVDHDLGEFAANPQLLTFLVEAYCKEPSVAQGRTGLYRQHLIKLLETSNRSTSSKTSTLTSEQILNVAERCAIATMFSGRSSICKSSSRRAEADDVVSFDDLLSSRLPGDAQVDSISKSTLDELISTPLFHLLPGGRAEWRHRSYAEYLAAVALSKSNIKPGQILSLFTTTVLAERGVPSQLRHCASFLVELRKDILDGFLQLEPEIFLLADISRLDDSQKENIVGSVLQQYLAGKSYDRIDLRSRYRRLAHPSLATQLKPIISNSEISSVVRRVAIDIAQGCNVTDLLPQLLALALNESERLHDRVQAILAIVHLGNADYILQLMCLLDLDEAEDPDCELRGSALLGLWPSFIDVRRLASLLPSITVPQLFGSFLQFLLFHLPGNLSDDVIPEIFDLLTVLVRKPNDRHYYYRLALVAVLKSLNLVLERKDVCTALCSFLLAPSSYGTSLRWFSSVGDVEELHQAILARLRSDKLARQAIIAQLSIAFDDANSNVSWLRHEIEGLIDSRDLEWYISQLSHQLSSRQRSFYCSLIAIIAEWDDVNYADKVLTAASLHSDLHAILKHMIDPVEISSAEANQMRLWAINAQSRETVQSKVNENRYARELRSILESSSQNNHEAWIRICEIMSADVDTGCYDEILNPNVTSSRLWILLDEHDQNLLCDLALRYIKLHQIEHTVKPVKSISWQSLAMYKAVYLLFNRRSCDFLKIDRDVYDKWIPSAMFYPAGYGLGDDDMHACIISAAYKDCPDTVLQCFKALLEQEISDIRLKSIDESGQPTNTVLLCQNKLSFCWDSDVEKLLMDVIHDNRDIPEIESSLLSFMLKNGSVSAKLYVMTVLETVVPSSDVERFRWIVCAVMMLSITKQENWDENWRMLCKAPELTKEAFLDYAYEERYSGNSLVTQLSESQLATLYIWLVRQFPYDTDPVHKGAHAVSARDMIGDYRDNILRALKDRGTVEAVNELERIRTEYPDLQFLSYTLVDARKRAHEFAWKAINPAEIFSILSESRNRLIRSSVDLRDMIVESLDNLSSKLQSHVSPVEFLWNTPSDKKYTPKEETALSNYIRNHLESELLPPRRVIINREVAIDCRGHVGKKVDILIDCLCKVDSRERIKAVVEVKCCWNRYLMTAMRTQLVEQYMNDPDCLVGVYVVGYYDSNCWDEQHRRMKNCKHKGKADLLEQLQKQAKELSNSNMIIVPYVVDLSLNR